MNLRWPTTHIMSAVFVPLLVLSLLAATQPGTRQEKASAREQPKPARVPFRAGETLSYQVRWANFLNAATVRLSVRGPRMFSGREAWHFQAVAHTVDPVRLLYSLDDQFDSLSDVGDLTSIQFEMRIREQGEEETKISRMSQEGQPAKGDGTTVRVPAGTRDALGMIYYLRGVDWAKTRQIRAPVYDGRKLYDARARLELENGRVTVPAGTYSASRIEVRVYEKEKEVPQTRFWLWLAQNPARTPVLMEAELPFGTLRVELRQVRE